MKKPTRYQREDVDEGRWSDVRTEKNERLLLDIDSVEEKYLTSRFNVVH